MPKPQPITPPAQPVQPTQPPPKIHVKDQPSGGLSVTFQIEPQDAKRLRLKAGGMQIDRFIYENIIKRAVESFLY